MSSASPLADRRLVAGSRIARRIAALDPVRDNEEIAHLSVEVRYGDAFFVHAAYLVAFTRQVAVPSIARIVHRTGTGDLMKDVRRRNDHTLVFFGEMLRHGHSSARGGAAIDRMEQIHSRFGITDDDKLYTLGSLAFEGQRILDLVGVSRFSEHELLGLFHFWRGVGLRMGLTVPDTRADLLQWVRDYEADRYGYTEGGRALVDQLFADWRARWFPGPLRPLADPVLLTLLDDRLRATHRLPDPAPRVRAAVPAVVRGYLALQGARPHRPSRSWADHFSGGAAIPAGLASYGHRGAAPRQGAPARPPATP
ncbi:oxygenase MpaB family protein [Nocardioides sp. MH1]|uniref:oxygenase MpaB family protein n=1 Tax=Nocardioides sp. MH1 TaxID=3242490 RepID=UPI003522F6CE